MNNEIYNELLEMRETLKNSQNIILIHNFKGLSSIYEVEKAIERDL